MTSRSSRRPSRAGLLLAALAMACDHRAAAPQPPPAEEPQGPFRLEDLAGAFRAFYDDAISDDTLASAEERGGRFRSMLGRQQALSREATEALQAASLDGAGEADLYRLAGAGRGAAAVLVTLGLGKALTQPDESRRASTYDLSCAVSLALRYGWFQRHCDERRMGAAAGGATFTNSRARPPAAPQLDARRLDRLAELLSETPVPGWAERVALWRLGEAGPRGLLSASTAAAWARLAALETGLAAELDRFFGLAAGRSPAAREVEAPARPGGAGPPARAAAASEVVEHLLAMKMPWEARRFIDEAEGRGRLAAGGLRARAQEAWERDFQRRLSRGAAPWFVAGVRLEAGSDLAEVARRIEAQQAAPRD